MGDVSFETISWIDEGVFLAALEAAELQDWCALQQACRWSCAAVSTALPMLKEDRASAGDTSLEKVLDCCKEGDVTGLWARVEAGEELIWPDGVRMDPNNEDTLLHIAARARVGEQNCRMFRWLVSRPGADVVALCKNKRGQTPLHICSRHGCELRARWFLSLPKVDTDAQDIYESTPLLDAVREEHAGVVKLLLEHAADVNAFVPNCHGHGESPLILAVRLKNLEILKMVLQSNDVDLHQQSMDGVPFGNSALDFAREGSKIHTVLLDEINRRAAASNMLESTSPQPLSAPVSSAQHQYAGDALQDAYWPPRTANIAVDTHLEHATRSLAQTHLESCIGKDEDLHKQALSILASSVQKICRVWGCACATGI